MTMALKYFFVEYITWCNTILGKLNLILFFKIDQGLSVKKVFLGTILIH